jgi:hypothetical protein
MCQKGEKETSQDFSFQGLFFKKSRLEFNPSVEAKIDELCR